LRKRFDRRTAKAQDTDDNADGMAVSTSRRLPLRRLERALGPALGSADEPPGLPSPLVPAEQ
jgi:hypothetical protein